MASPSLNSMELLDLLFDQQDGVLRNVELGSSVGAWMGPEDRVSNHIYVHRESGEGSSHGVVNEQDIHSMICFPLPRHVVSALSRIWQLELKEHTG